MNIQENPWINHSHNLATRIFYKIVLGPEDF